MSSQKNFDVIVVGVGAMGAATCYQLARRGMRVLGLEQFDIPHARGSSHGYSRVTRLAYYEHPNYVPLLRRSFELWNDLELELGQTVLHHTGCLSIGPAAGEVIAGVKRSCDEHGLAHDWLDPQERRKRFPQFVVPESFVGIVDHVGGALLPERVVAGYAELAMRRGAVLHAHEAVVDWKDEGAGVQVTTSRGETYFANRLVFCGGPWSGMLVRDLGVELVVTRQVLGWVWPKQPDRFALGKLPVWILDHGDGRFHYGFPMLPDNPGFKLASHHIGKPTDPDHMDRTVGPADETQFRDCLADNLPDANGPLLAMRTCLYTNSPDQHFIVDRHPRYPNVTIACGFSGHGFKFASVMGEAISDLAISGQSRLPIGFLGLNRFGPP